MIFLSLFSIPFIAILFSFIYFKKNITLKEFLIQSGFQVVVVVSAIGIMYSQNVGDTEIWNGIVTSKQKKRVSCDHSYSCNCTTDDKGNTSCQTCYEHSWDYDWIARTNVDKTIVIDRVNRQGTQEPPRWTIIKKGDPVAVKKGYTNYIKGASHSLFKKEELVNQFSKILPKYPKNIYDYHYLNRVIKVGSINYMFRGWKEKLQIINSELGNSKQVNMIVVVTKNQTRDFFYALEQHWLGGKKNDAILVINTDDDLNITWTKVMALTQSNMFQVQLESDIMDNKLLDNKILKIFKKNVIANFKRKPMKEFEYLKASIQPSKTQFVVSFIISLILSIVGIFIARNNRERNYY